MSLKKKVGIILLIILISFPSTRANAQTVSDMSEELICQCGCSLVLGSCTHAECSSRDMMTTSIEEKLAQGQPEEQIIQFFVTQYGEQVLSSPTKQGFNLVVWILPFSVILGGGGIIYFALRAWVRRDKAQQAGTTAKADDENDDEKYQHRLEKELRDFTGEGFR